jgi:hypothetical protein
MRPANVASTGSNRSARSRGTIRITGTSAQSNRVKRSSGDNHPIDIYAKNEKEDLTDAEKREARKLVTALEAEA